MQIVVGESNRNWGFVAGGWASTQLSPRSGMPVVSASGLGHLLTTGQMRDALSPTSLTQRLVPPAPLGSSIAMAPQCHGLSTVSKLGNPTGDTWGWRWSVGSLPLCQHESKTHFYRVAHMTEQSLPSVCQHWDCPDNNPSCCVCVSRGCPAQSRESCFIHKNPLWVWPCSRPCAGWAGSHPPSPGAHLFPCRGQQV